MAYVPRKGKSPDTIHKIRDELDTVLAGAASRTMQRVAGLRNEELSEAASPGHVRATALVKQLQSGDVESAVDQLLNLAKYMDIRKAMFDAGAIELLVGMVEFLVKEYISLGHIPPNDLSYRGVVHLLYYLANDSSVSCYHYTDRIAEAGAIPLLFHILRGLVDLNWDSTIEAKEIKADAAGVLEILAKRQEADFDSVEKLASLIREGTSHTMYGYTIDHNDAAYMLYHLARNNPDRQRAFLEAKGLFPGLIKLSRRSYPSGQGAKLLLKLFDHPTLASKIASLEQEMEILKRRLSRHEGVVDVTGDGGDAPPVENKLREEHDRATKKKLVKVKEEKADAEGARDRTDAIAAEASVAAASERERADDQGTNAMYLHTQKSELQRLVSDAANALLDSDADVPTKEVDDDATPFYYILESHRDDGKQTVLWNVEADRAMTLAEGIAWIQNNRPNKRPRRR